MLPIRKLVLFLFFLVFFLVFTPKITLALVSPPAFVDPTSQNWDFVKQATAMFHSLAGGLSCISFGLPFATNQCPEVVYKDGVPSIKLAEGFSSGGAVGAIARAETMMYTNQPASGIQYTAQVIRNGVNFVSPAYAQVTGNGASVVQPIQKLWQLTRNVAYAGFIVIFVVVGLMIILRRKLNPQTVVSIQSALPGIVIALVLVTFSYFIAGLIIDVAFLGSQMIGILILSQLGNDPSATTHVSAILKERNVLSIFSQFAINSSILSVVPEVGSAIQTTAGLGGSIVMGIVGLIAGCVGGVLSPLILTSPVSACLIGGAVGGGGGAVLGGYILSALLMVILLIGLLQAMFRLLFSLITAYVQLILYTIFGPLLILWSALPGNGAIVTVWIKNMLANALIFPAVFGMFLLVAALLGFGDPWFLQNSVGNFTQAPPLFGGITQGFVRLILAYGILLAAPGLPDFVRELLGAKTSQILNQAAMTSFRGGTRGTTLLAPAGISLGRGIWGRVRTRI